MTSWSDTFANLRSPSAASHGAASNQSVQELVGGFTACSAVNDAMRRAADSSALLTACTATRSMAESSSVARAIMDAQRTGIAHSATLHAAVSVQSSLCELHAMGGASAFSANAPAAALSACAVQSTADAIAALVGGVSQLDSASLASLSATHHVAEQMRTAREVMGTSCSYQTVGSRTPMVAAWAETASAVARAWAVEQGWQRSADTAGIVPLLKTVRARLYLDDTVCAKIEQHDAFAQLEPFSRVTQLNQPDHTPRADWDNVRSWMQKAVQEDWHVLRSAVGHEISHLLLPWNRPDPKASSYFFDGQLRTSAFHAYVSAKNRRRVMGSLLEQLDFEVLASDRWSEIDEQALLGLLRRKLRQFVQFRVRAEIVAGPHQTDTCRDLVFSYRFRTGCPPPAADAARSCALTLSEVQSGGLNGFTYFRHPVVEAGPVARMHDRLGMRLRNRSRSRFHVSRALPYRRCDMAGSRRPGPRSALRHGRGPRCNQHPSRMKDMHG